MPLINHGSRAHNFNTTAITSMLPPSPKNLTTPSYQSPATLQLSCVDQFSRYVAYGPLYYLNEKPHGTINSHRVRSTTGAASYPTTPHSRVADSLHPEKAQGGQMWARATTKAMVPKLKGIPISLGHSPR